MKKPILSVLLAALVLVVPRLAGQDKERSADAARPAEAAKAMTPLRVQVVFTDFEGERKISSLPYTFLVNADDHGAPAAVRMGLRVPIETSSNTGVKQFQYMDVGTNLDGRAEKTDDGRFLLRLGVERSSVYVPGTEGKSAAVGGSQISNAQPI